MTDQEVLCEFMGWMLGPDRCKVCGWKYSGKPAGCRPDSCLLRPPPEKRADALPEMTLVECWEIEEKLQDDARKDPEAYARRDLYVDLLAEQIDGLWHSDAPTRIQALAAVIRALVEAREA